jgi:Fur family transcriptional regulator, zinc uptake regulator
MSRDFAKNAPRGKASSPPKMPREALFPPEGHDHAACVSAGQARVEQAFEHAGLRMTPLRAQVFGELSSSHGAIGAYDILERIAVKGKRLAPISVYRALDALVAAGVVHKLQSRNAFFACQQAHVAQRPYLVLVCSGCGRVAEAAAPRVWDAIDRAVRAVDFAFEGSLVEVTGRCGTCAP